jgi:gliding motility-associated-like protein
LFEALGGNPDLGGTWSSNLSNGNGVFSLALDDSNMYSYTVDNGVCGVSTSTVEVEVLRNTEIFNATVLVHDFSTDGNSVEIQIPTNRVYEYSLDGVNYQLDHILKKVPGGKQTVFARGLDGCQYFTKEVFVKTYPVFFSPNLDGVNDTWQLKDFPDVNYTIYIYNRFGRMIQQMANKNKYWDGKQNGTDLPSSNYWFKVVLENGETLQGNFSLIR